MSKNTIIILGVVITLIIFGVIIVSFLQKEKVVPTGESIPEESSLGETTEPEVFSLSAIVLSVNAVDNSIIVKLENKETEIKVILNEGTKITQLGIPSDIEDMPKQGGVFIPTEKDINISEISKGDKIFITTNTNIAGKIEFDDVIIVQVYP